ncbi:helix-turn-helix domain-containing protein [Tissierella sp.]|uniref:helix-turn-helix domain-containing protein n=1 Tax=Tissierella sp. TaxID=41274 RepID=UPI0028B0EC14|nr:helix-turn-helix domain-containing protein [Tissierella sp.]
MYEVKVPYEILEKLDIKEIGVYVALKKYMDWNKYTCYPSISTLAEDLNCSQNTVRKYLRQLEKRGVISIEYRILKKQDKKGKEKTWNNTNLYTFILEKVFKNKGVLQDKKRIVHRLKTNKN